MSHDEIEELKKEKDKLVKEMIEQCKGNGNISIIDTYAHTIKNICKIIESAEEDEMEGYSGYPPMRMNTGYSNAPYMMNPQPYEYSWGRGMNAPRDSMGRYSSHGDLKAALYEAMNHASNEAERQQVQDLINRMG